MVLIMLPVLILVYLWALLLNGMNIIDFFSITELEAYVHFPSFNYYVKEDGGITIGMFVYIMNLLVRPSQITIVMDFLLAIAFALN